MAESDNILTKLHDLLLYVIPQLNKFPRDQNLAAALRRTSPPGVSLAESQCFGERCQTWRPERGTERRHSCRLWGCAYVSAAGRQECRRSCRRCCRWSEAR